MLSKSRRDKNGDNVLIVFATLNHDLNPSKRRNMKASPINVKKDVWIKAQDAILTGITIAEGSILAIMAIVTKEVEPYSVVMGAPAKVIKMIEK